MFKHWTDSYTISYTFRGKPSGNANLREKDTPYVICFSHMITGKMREIYSRVSNGMNFCFKI